MGVAHPHQDLAESGQELAGVAGASGEELDGVDPGGIGNLDVRKDDLQGALEDLDLAAGVQVIARLEAVGEGLAGVPEPGADAAGLVAQFQVQVEVALAVGAELFIGDEEDLVDGFAVGELVHIAASHGRRL